MNKYPLINLPQEYQQIKSEIVPKLLSVIENANFISGEDCVAFEKNFADFCNAKYCVGVSSGTSAIFLALKSLGICEGDEVITTSLTFTATAEAIVHCGAKPIFVDIDKETMQIDVSKIEKLINEKTKAIIAVHLYGIPAELDGLLKICSKNKLFLIEDCAQAHGAIYKGRKVGTFGNVGCFSFMPAKNIGAYGDAGCIITNNEIIYEKVKLLRDHGRKTKYAHISVGYCDRLDNMQAAVLNIKLKHLNNWNETRRKIAKIYDTLIDSKYITKVKVPINSISSYYVYTIKIDSKRTLFQEKLNELGISTGIYYPSPLHLLEAYSYLGYDKNSLPVSEEECSKIISIPMNPFISEDDAKYIASSVNSVISNLMQD